eukprot:2631049-Rhodomonas_salina.1
MTLRDGGRNDSSRNHLNVVCGGIGAAVRVKGEESGGGVGKESEMYRQWQLAFLLLVICMDGALEAKAKSKAKSKPKQKSLNRVIPVPSNLVHPSKLAQVDETDYNSLLEHGYALAEYGEKLSAYARPACEVDSVLAACATAMKCVVLTFRLVRRGCAMVHLL